MFIKNIAMEFYIKIEVDNTIIRRSSAEAALNYLVEKLSPINKVLGVESETEIFPYPHPVTKRQLLNAYMILRRSNCRQLDYVCLVNIYGDIVCLMNNRKSVRHRYVVYFHEDYD